jgi:anti-sigma regulatory factor (Ser/Thr protein kinase)
VTTMDETARLAALRKYRILDTDPEQAFDDLTLLASHVCGTPIALISLLDADRQWFKSRVGLSITETSRSVSFCAHAIRQNGLFIVPDARDSPRFRDNPFVAAENGIRFYAGAPLITPAGYALGTLCVLDRVPRTLTTEQLEALQALRRQVEAQLELRSNLFDLDAALKARDVAEVQQLRLIDELRESLDNVQKLSGLIPYCSECQFDMTIPADPRAIPTLTDGVRQVLQDKGWPEDRTMEVELALQEALANAIRHGCKGDPSRQVQCVVHCEGKEEILVIVRDPGTGFDATAVPDPLRAENVLKASGRGIFLINQLMDEVEFNDGGRELLMRKRSDGNRRREAVECRLKTED